MYFKCSKAHKCLETIKYLVLDLHNDIIYIQTITWQQVKIVSDPSNGNFSYQIIYKIIILYYKKKKEIVINIKFANHTHKILTNIK